MRARANLSLRCPRALRARGHLAPPFVGLRTTQSLHTFVVNRIAPPHPLQKRLYCMCSRVQRTPTPSAGILKCVCTSITTPSGCLYPSVVLVPASSNQVVRRTERGVHGCLAADVRSAKFHSFCGRVLPVVPDSTEAKQCNAVR